MLTRPAVFRGSNNQVRREVAKFGCRAGARHVTSLKLVFQDGGIELLVFIFTTHRPSGCLSRRYCQVCRKVTTFKGKSRTRHIFTALDIGLLES